MLKRKSGDESHCENCLPRRKRGRWVFFGTPESRERRVPNTEKGLHYQTAIREFTASFVESKAGLLRGKRR